MANGAFKFKDNSGNVVSFISGSGSNISFSGGTLDLSGMTGLTLGNLTLSGTTQNALSASHAASYLLTSSFNTYSGTTDTVIGTLQTSTSSLNSFTSSATTRLNSIETSSGSLNSYTSSNNTKLGVIESTTASLNSYTSSNTTNINAIHTSTGSLNTFTSSATTRLNSIEGVSGSYATTGSNQFKNDQVITGSLTVTGFIETQELRTTYISSSILYRSGSTKFGDELSDTHTFTGSLLVSGTISVSGSGLISGSSQILNGSGVFSGSAQLPSGIVSGSAQTIANLPSGVVSGSAQTIANLPSGTVSGSSQVLNGTTIHSGSFFNGISVVSGSVQVDVMSTTNIARLATTGSNVFTSNQIISGSVGIYSISSSGSLQIGTPGNNGTNNICLTGGGSYPNTYIGSFGGTTYFTNNYSYLSGHRSDDATKRSMEISMDQDMVMISTMASASPGTRVRLLTVSGSAGFIGINTSTPNASLTVSGGAISFPSNMSSGFVGYSLFQNGSKLTIAGGSGGIQLNNTANSSGLVSLFDNGNFLIGNTGVDAGFKLNVIGRGNFGGVDTPYIDFKSTDTPGVGWQYKQISFKDTSNNELYAIGYHYPNLKFDVSGSRAMTLTNTGHGALGTITPSSWGSGTTALQVGTTAGLWSRASDGLTVLASNSYFNGSADLQITTGTANRMYFLNGNTYLERAASASAGAGTSWTTSMTITNSGYVHLGKGWGATNHRINLEVAQGNRILVISAYAGASNDSVLISAASGANSNAAADVISVTTNTSTGRSISAGGTINASGNDYAEYMLKAVTDTISKGEIVGIDNEGLLTNIFSDSVSFVVKSTNPSYVGGDAWGTVVGKRPERTTDQTEEEFAPILAEFEAKLEVERQKVDRIAFSGQVPVNVTGATVGDYIIPISTEDGKITGQAITNPTFEQYQISVGKVWKIMEDSRAFIAVKIG